MVGPLTLQAVLLACVPLAVFSGMVQSLLRVRQAANLLAKVRIWSEGDEKVSLVLARLSLDGQRPQTVGTTDGDELGGPQFPLLGISGASALFLNRYTATILGR